MSFLSGPIATGPIADALSRTLFHFLWEGALIAAALAVAIYVFRPSSKELAQNGGRREIAPDPAGGARRPLCASASIRYNLACAAMLAMVMAFATNWQRRWPRAGRTPLW